MEEHMFALRRIFEDIYCSKVTTWRPDFEAVWNQLNLKASIGLPKPWIKKRQMKAECLSLYNLFTSSKLDLLQFIEANSKSVPLTAAFLRCQITDSGLKVRLVFAVCWCFVFIETYFNLISKFLMWDGNSNAVHGYTQADLSILCAQNSGLWTTCLDYKKFDLRVPSFVIIAVALLDVQVLCLNLYETNLFLSVVAFFIVMPVFHPSLEFRQKVCGISSGSGFTSLFGSKCNYYMLWVAMFKYCKMHNINLSSVTIIINVSSDDTVINTSFWLNFKTFRSILVKTFGVDSELEYESDLSKNECFFLGSKWIDGKPYRNIDRMFARILFGSPNLPEMTTLQLFQSRCYEILGNTCQFRMIYDSFRVPYPNRVFRILELADYQNRQYIETKLTGHEKRGYFVNLNLNRDTCNNVWLTR
jgi:hypothetical protein